MTTILKDFVTVRKTRGDILNPAEYRSIVELIRGILKRYDFTSLNNDYLRLLAHIVNYTNPHEDDTSDFFEIIVEKTYAIYVDMIQEPLSLAQFKIEIVPTLGFIELIRRILLNRYLYDSIKYPNGSVPSTVTVKLTNDWFDGVQSTPLTLSFGDTDLLNEVDFIRLGWNGNSTPFPVVFNALFLTSATKALTLLFCTSSFAQFLTPTDLGSGFTTPLSLTAREMTINLSVIGTPAVNTSIFSISNSFDTLRVVVNANRNVVVLLNNTPLVQTTNVTTDGNIQVAITKTGRLSLKTTQNGMRTSQTVDIEFTNDIMFTGCAVTIPYENLITPIFGLRSLSIYSGVSDALPFIPEGYVAVIDSDGSYLVDFDGSYIIDVA